MDQSYLRFSLEESIWFKKGQEVSELISIALDPVISVDEYEHYITIRGALELSGEYRMTEEEESDSELFDFSAHRFVQRVTTREDGISELFHRFPVDITIPKNRIQNLEDVYVTVESFDYDLGENGQLVLTADISISGIGEETRNESIQYEEEEEEPLFEPFEVVARKEAYEEETEQFEEREVYDESLEEEKNEEASPISAAQTELVQKESEVLNRNEDKEQLATIAEEIDTVQEKEETKVSIGAMKQIENRDENEEESADKKVKEYSKSKNENALYLTKLFEKGQGEDFSRVKICIVQQGDSLDKIAERYDVTVQHLLRANHLDYGTDIHEGQLLYIPVPAGSRA